MMKEMQRLYAQVFCMSFCHWTLDIVSLCKQYTVIRKKPWNVCAGVPLQKPTTLVPSVLEFCLALPYQPLLPGYITVRILSPNLPKNLFHLMLFSGTLKETHGYARDALLYIYATFLIPVVFSMLIGLNLHVWTRCNINYAFIFGG